MFGRRARVLSVVLIAATLGLTGCASSSPSSSAGPSVPSGSSTGGPALKIGVVEQDRSQLFSTQQHPAIEKALQARGWSVNFVDAKGSSANAISAIQNLVQSKVDAIVVQTYSADQLSSGLAAAKDAGIPVFSTGGGPVGAGMAGAIEYIGAEPINDTLTKAVKDKPDVKLLELDYTPGAPCRARTDNLQQQLKSLPNVSATSRQLAFPGVDQVSQTAATGWLQSNPEQPGRSFAIWICTSDALAGVLAAEKQAGRGPYPVYTWDLSAPVIQAVRNGQVAGVLYLPAEQSAEQLADLIQQQHSAGASWAAKTISADAVVVTKDNVDKYATAQ